MTCTTTVLRDALRMAKPALSLNNILPVMQSYCFTGSHVFAYNDFMAIGVALSTPFVGAVPGDALRKCVDTFRAEALTFVEDDDTLLIKNGRSKVSFTTLPPSSFALNPDELADGALGTVTVDRAFTEGLQAAMISIDTQFFFDVYGSVALALTPGDPLEFYSTDDQTLTRVQLTDSECPALPGFDHGAILLPNDFCKQFVSVYNHFFGDHNGEVKLHLTNEYLFADFGGGTGWIMVELPEAELIPYREVYDDSMPETQPDEWARVDDELRAILTRAEALWKVNVGKHQTQETLYLSEGKNEAEVRLEQETGDQSLADTWTGGLAPEGEIVVNPKLMLRAAKALDEVHWASGEVVVFRNGAYITHLVSLG